MVTTVSTIPKTPILFATSNAGKITEMNQLASHSPYEVKPLGVELTDEENADTFVGNAIIKAQEAARKAPEGTELVMAEDSGLTVDALSQETPEALKTHFDINKDDYKAGFPGVRSNRFMTPQLQEMVNTMKTEQGIQQPENPKKAAELDRNLAILKMMEGQTNRNAAYHAAFVLVDVKHPSTMYVGEGEWPLKVAESLHPGNGFGYDPIMLDRETNNPVSKMTLEEKNAASHRAKAFNALMTNLATKKTFSLNPTEN
jgi:XTP/dITP diphosphohydrolase